MLDRFNRKIDYLRISVTDRCNYRCIYCMPDRPFIWKEPGDILSYEQIESVTKVAAGMGITKVRLTGGEPLVRKDVELLVAKLAAIEGIEQVCMTTNGSLLADKAEQLKQNGLTRLNISIVSLDDERYRRITGGGHLRQVLAGVAAALKAGFTAMKINMVVLDDTAEEDIEQMAAFCRQMGLQLQTIMHFSLHNKANLSRRVQTARPPQCSKCNRLRLTADGYLLPCLFSDKDVRVDFGDIAGSFREAATNKPMNGTSCTNRVMSQIGG